MWLRTIARPLRVGARAQQTASYDALASAPPVVGGCEAGAQETQEEPFVDNFGRVHDYLRISLTEKCNLRCVYCMPAEGVPLSAKAHLLSREELLRVVRLMAERGVSRVRLTGGEPTLRKDLPHIVEQLKAVRGIRSVSMTTNGVSLTKQLVALQQAGLDAVNISLDTLKEDRYEQLTRRPGVIMKRVLAGVDLAIQLGYRPAKINVVLMKGVNDDELVDFVGLTKDRDLDVRFIEFMPFGGNAWAKGKLLPYRHALRAIAKEYTLTPLQGAKSDTAMAAVVRVGPFGKGRVHRLHDAPLLRRMQPTQAHGRRTSQGLSAGWRRDQSSAADEVWGLRPSARGYHSDRAGAEEGAARGDGQPGPDAEQADDPHRRLKIEQGGSLTHVGREGRARMVDVGDKPITTRRAEARCRVEVSRLALTLLLERKLVKGDALSTAELAGVMAAKQTHLLIPLCHALNLSHVAVSVQLPELPSVESSPTPAVQVSCSVRVEGRTGAEMEALVGAAMAALALIDMVKAVDRKARVNDLRVSHKEGGKSGLHSERTEAYAPTSFLH